MITQNQVQSLIGQTAYDRSGDKIGKIGTVYYDDQTQEPKWVTVHTGLFGTNESFVPLTGAEVRGDDLTLGFEKAQIKDAPNVSSDAHLSVQEEEELYRYYGLEYGSGGVAGGDYDRTGRQDTERTTTTGTAGYDADRSTGRDTADYERSRGHDTSGPNTDDAMTRSEERLNVGTETREAGRARLRKHVVTENQQVQVPVSHEEVRVEREPITDANRGDAYAGGDITEEEHEVTLREERPVVDKEAVPVERVRLGTETVRETETVGGEVRREEIEVDDDVTTGRRRDRR